jgi:hypothetical protein
VTRLWRLEEGAAARCEDRDFKRLETNDFLPGPALPPDLECDLTGRGQEDARIAGGRVLTSDTGADGLLLLVIDADEELVLGRGDVLLKGNWTWTGFADIADATDSIRCSRCYLGSSSNRGFSCKVLAFVFRRMPHPLCSPGYLSTRNCALDPIQSLN